MKQLRGSQSSIINISDDGGKKSDRVFPYALNIKKAKAKLLKGAKRSKNLEIERKRGCTNMRIDDGSFFEVVIPLLNLWKEKLNEEIIIDQSVIEIIEVEEGMEVSSKSVDCKVVVLFNSDRITLHSYKTTQNLMVQGKTHEEFVCDILEPYFRKMIEKAMDSNNKFNDEVKEQFSPKQKMGSTLNCQQCDVQATTKANLRVHLKTCHTKPEIKSPQRKKMLKLTHGGSPSKILKHQDATLFKCSHCEFHSNTEDILNKHVTVIHDKSANDGANTISELSADEVLLLEDTDEQLLDNKEETMEENAMQFECDNCNFAVNSKSKLQIHVQTVHKQMCVDVPRIVSIQCELCDYKCMYNIQLKKHMKTYHERVMSEPKYNCRDCDFASHYYLYSWKHREDMHMNTSEHPTTDPKYMAQALIAEQNIDVFCELESLKKDLKEAFSTLSDNIESKIASLRKDFTVANAIHLEAISSLDNTTEVQCHMEKVNENLASLNSMGVHVNEIIEDIPKTQNEIKQELFIIRNSQEKSDKNPNVGSKENLKDDNARNEDHRVKDKSWNSRASNQRNDMRQKDDWHKKKRYTGGRDSRDVSRYSQYKHDKPQYGRYNRWNSKSNAQDHRQNIYPQMHRRMNHVDRNYTSPDFRHGKPVNRRYNFPDFEHRRKNVFDSPYIIPRYENRYESRQYNYPHHYDMQNRAYETEFLWPTSNRFSVMGNY